MDIGDEVRDEVSVVWTLLSSSSVCVGLFSALLVLHSFHAPCSAEEEVRRRRRGAQGARMPHAPALLLHELLPRCADRGHRYD